MEVRITHQLAPTEKNPRNGEGAFIRGKGGEILFAYSRYGGDSVEDHAACDIALIVSYDEGESWSEPRIIAPAAFFGTKNVMSVSALRQKNGDLAFYFLIKENDFTTTVGRAVSHDGVNFTPERCIVDFPPNYYVINNDRLVRLRSGRILAPAAFITAEENRDSSTSERRYPYRTTLLYSDDDGASFRTVGWQKVVNNGLSNDRGLQEPGIIELEGGELFLWMRTAFHSQYEAFSKGDVECFSEALPGRFTSPPSPMQIKSYGGETYAVYNPIPNYNGRVSVSGTWGRTPFVIRKSTDELSFGEINVIEDDEHRGYCYPAMFFTEDGHLLLAYCRGSRTVDGDGNTLCRLGISKIKLDTIK